MLMQSSFILAARPDKNDAGKNFDVNREFGVLPEGIEAEKSQLVANFTVLFGTSIFTLATVVKWWVTKMMPPFFNFWWNPQV